MSGDPGERTAWVALASVAGVGDVTFGRLLAQHGGAAAAARAIANGAPLAHEDGRLIASAVRSAIAVAARDPTGVERRLAASGVWTVTPMDTDYPSRLDVLDPKPAVLYGWGDRSALEQPRAVAVVGTRRPTITGRGLAAHIATRLVEAEAVVVSGLAFGIDGAAHAAAVGAGGRTVAIIGGGHEHAGPAAHRRLTKDILDHGGAVVSEMPPDARPSHGTFPRRNRIISALGDATIVVEAPHRSGALITARHALEQGRPVLVAPGRPGDRAVAGCLALLRESPARPFVGLDEMIADLGWDEIPGAMSRSATPMQSDALSARTALSLVGPAERAVAERLMAGPAGADGLVADTGLSAAVVSSALTLLLMRGWAQVMGPAYLAAGPLLAADHR